MVVVADIYGNDVAMMAIEQNGNLYMLAPVDGKMHKYVMDNHKLELTIDNISHTLEAYANDNPTDIKDIFDKFDEANQNYFDELSSELILLVCKKD